MSISKKFSINKSIAAAKGKDPFMHHEVCSKLTITLSIFSLLSDVSIVDFE